MMKNCEHETPCDSLVNFKKLILLIMGLNSFVIVLAFGFATTSQMKAGEAIQAVNQVMQKQIEQGERQKVVEKKADDALGKANTAMAISAKTEANIEWIRNGQTELKTLVLNYLGVKKVNQ